MAREVLVMVGRGHICRIDEPDVRLVAMYRWSVSWTSETTAYATGKRGTESVTMHRLILGATAGQLVDHINGDTLDNRRHNLRIATHAENSANRKRQMSVSGYKGVHWDSSRQSWEAVLTHEGKRVRCGTSADPVKAAKKYDDKARRIHGALARTNFSCACGLSELCQECSAPSPWKREPKDSKARQSGSSVEVASTVDSG